MKKGKLGILEDYLFLVPALLIYLSVIVFPVFYSVFISLHKTNGVGEMVFVGLDNFRQLIFDDPVFHIAIRNNMIWILLTIFVTMTLALLLAVLLNKPFKGRTFFRGFFYFPCVIAPIAVAIIWRWIYNPNVGFVNQLFEALGLSFRQSWISDPNASLFAIFVAALWQSVGQSMILFLAGLQAVSADVLEAATIDGATGMRKFFRIVVPLLKETFIIVGATLIVAAMKVFDVVQGLTGGGPNNATQMLSTYMYAQTFQYNNVGMGTAIAVIMVVVMLVVIVPYISFTVREE